MAKQFPEKTLRIHKIRVGNGADLCVKCIDYFATIVVIYVRFKKDYFYNDWKGTKT